MAVETRDILKSLGSPGRFATVIFFLCYLTFYYVVFCDIFPSIYGAVPVHRCALPGGNQASPAVINTSLPVTEDGSYSSCEVYVNHSRDSGQTEGCTHGWVYQVNPGEATVPSDWDLVCDRSYLNSLTISLYYVGVVCGAVLFGSLSDLWGRRPVLLVSLLLSVFTSSLVYFSESFIVFTALRFTAGIAKQGVHITLYVIGLEYFASATHRAIAVAIIDTTWSVGGILLAGISYLFQDWRTVQLWIIIPCLLPVFYAWFLPESLRWQMSKKKYKAAVQTIKRISLFNKIPLEPEFSSQENLERAVNESGHQSAEKTDYTALDLFRSPRIRRRTLLLLYIWFANSLLYYGLLLNSFRLPGNRFMNIGISMAVELPTYIFFPFIVKKTNRKITLVTFCLLSALFSTTAAFMPVQTASLDLGWLYITLYNAAKVCSTITWAVLSLITFELYPTCMRASGFGSCHLSSKIGSIVAPQILSLAQMEAEWFALFLPGFCTFIAALVALLLPDTKHAKLPETLQEAEDTESPIDRLMNRCACSRESSELPAPSLNNGNVYVGVSPEDGGALDSGKTEPREIVSLNDITDQKEEDGDVQNVKYLRG